MLHAFFSVARIVQWQINTFPVCPTRNGIIPINGARSLLMSAGTKTLEETWLMFGAKSFHATFRSVINRSLEYLGPQLSLL